MASVSYANIAANGTVKSASPVSEEPTPLAAEALETPELLPVSEEAPKPEKKVLAPAPVPSKSAWGAPAPAAAAVDEHKWPTPGKVAESQTHTKPAASRFIKPNKWVPIPAKVVLPSPKSAQYQNGAGAKNKRKNKAGKKKTADDKRDDRPKDVDADDEDVSADAAADSQHAYDTYRLRLGGQNKTYRKFASAQNGRPPQARYYQQAPYPNTKQYKQNGTNGHANGNAVGANGGGYTSYGGYLPFAHPQALLAQGMPYGTPMPVFIPPPISPKQDPLAALTQQIDYYFSFDNLIRDVFLRTNMGTEGWVDLDLILNFKRVKIIVNGIHNSIDEADEAKKSALLDAAILTAVQLCQNLEIGYLNGKDDNTATATEVQLRVKTNFEQWLLPDM